MVDYNVICGIHIVNYTVDYTVNNTVDYTVYYMINNTADYLVLHCDLWNTL